MQGKQRVIKANNTIHRPRKKTNALPLIPQKKVQKKRL